MVQKMGDGSPNNPLKFQDKSELMVVTLVSHSLLQSKCLSLIKEIF